MRITAGCTRVVFLVGDKAIKIPRLERGIVLVRQAYLSVFRRGWFKEKLAERTGKPGQILAKHVTGIAFEGILANRREYRAFRDHPELPIAPVRGMYLWGLVLVMDRGVNVGPRSSAHLRKRLKGWGDLAEPRHYCRVGGRVCIIDYGHPDLYPAFGIL